MTAVIAIDPGTVQSGFCFYVDGSLSGGVWPNSVVLDMLGRAQEGEAVLAVEMVSAMGMSVGREVFETVRWIGRFQQRWYSPEDVMLIPRTELKLAVCGTARATDTNIRRAMIDRFGPPGTKNNRGPTYGFRSHAWQALAVAAVAVDRIERP